MNYFVTGATGFIGKFLLEKLLAREDAKVYVLVRKSSAEKFEALKARYGAAGSKLVPLWGDITTPGLVSPADFKKLAGKVDHVFHLAAVYDMSMSDEEGDKINNEGTRNAVAFVNDLGGPAVLHHVSSVAVAGSDYVGTFRENMFDEGQSVDHPYYRSKFQSEAIVRNESKVPFRIYRPGVVVGHSETGEMDKIDGPYYFFKLIQRIRQMLPPWMPTVGLEGGRVNIVPVDFVVNAINVISHQPSIGKKCFHLVDPVGYRVGDVLDIFSRAAHAPRMNLFVNAALLGFIPKGIKKSLMAIAPVRRVRNAVLKDLGLPEDMLTFVNYPTRFDCRETLAALKGSGVQCP
ncbi:MAG: SDR family oxidoreductase, partial [Stagnimonas sp.]|nr:SDR family oxidoreductase [Stagnimonas sp.]